MEGVLMDITISKLKTGFLVFDEWDADDKHAFSTLDDVIEALPAMFQPVESAAPEIEPVSAPAYVEKPFGAYDSASEANGAADADPA